MLLIKIIILLIVFLFFYKIFSKNEHFYQSNILPEIRCSIIDSSGNIASDTSQNRNVNTRDGTSSSNPNLAPITVNPNLPECVGICINQHTNTSENIGSSGSSRNSVIGQLKTGHQPFHIRTSRCDQCIKNFYKGLKLMKDKNN